MPHQPEKKFIEWELNCTAEEALNTIDQSIDNILLPWFLSESKLKGFISGNNFYIWPNTFYSGITDSIIKGTITNSYDKSILEASVGLFPPLSFFRSSVKLNWLSGITMVLAWVGLVIAMITERYYLNNILGPLFAVTCIYNNIQLARMIQKPEMIDLNKRFYKVLSSNINKKIS